MTIPPSAAVGNRDRTGRATSRTTRTETAVASEYAWVLRPAAIAIAVLVPLLLTGKPAHQRRADVGDAERQQFPVRHDLLVAVRERAGRHHVVAEAHDQHGERGKQQLAQHPGIQGGQPDGRELRRDRADDADSARVQCRHRGGGEQRGQQRPRQARPAPPQQQQERQDGQGDREDGGLCLAQPAGERADLGEEHLAADRDAGRALELIADHDQGHPRHVADQHGPRQQVREEAQPQQPGRQRHQPGDQGERAGEFGVLDRVPGGQRLDGHQGHQRGGGLRAHGQRPGRAEQRVDDQRRERGPQTGDRRQARDRGVRHHLRHQVGRDGDAGQQVAGQPGAAIAAQHG